MVGAVQHRREAPQIAKGQSQEPAGPERRRDGRQQADSGELTPFREETQQPHAAR